MIASAFKLFLIEATVRPVRGRSVGQYLLILLPPHDLLSRGALAPRSRLWRVGEGETSGVDDSVVSDQGDWHLSGLSHPLPALPELTNLRHHTEQRLLAPVHRLCLHLSKPNLQVGGERLPGDLQHRHLSATVDVEVTDGGDGSDRAADGAHPLEESVLHLVCRDNGPTSTVIEHLLGRIFGTRSGLELDDFLLSEAQIHPVGVFHVERTFVKLRDGIIGVKGGHLLINLPDNEPWQGHSSNGANQLHGGAIVDVAVFDSELLRLRLVVVQ